jgi:hypothetical protein
MKLTEHELWGSPPTNDGAFLVALRERMSQRRAAPLWHSGRALAGVSALCALLLVAIWMPGGLNSYSMSDDYLTLESVIEQAESSSVDPDELAAYLGVDLYAATETDELDYSNEVVGEDELNSLNDADFNAMLIELEQARIF